jgi:hypothetical protein
MNAWEYSVKPTEHPVDETRRRFLKAAATAAGAAGTPGLAHAQALSQDQPVAHQTVPSDLTRRRAQDDLHRYFGIIIAPLA